MSSVFVRRNASQTFAKPRIDFSEISAWPKPSDVFIIPARVQCS